MVKFNNNKLFPFVSRCGHLRCRSRHFDCILLVFIRWKGRLVTHHLLKKDAPLWLVGYQQLWLVHPCFWNFYSTIPVDDVRMKSYVNYLFDPTCLPMRNTINKLYFVPKQVVSAVVSVFWNGRGLGTGKSDVSLMFFDSILQRSYGFGDVDFTAFTGNPVNHAILLSRLDSVFRSY